MAAQTAGESERLARPICADSLTRALARQRRGPPAHDPRAWGFLGECSGGRGNRCYEANHKWCVPMATL
jgi:hypothetical protein